MNHAVLTAAILILSLPASAQEPAQEPMTFKGYPCTQDCSGHKAGYEWAQKKAILAEEDCGGNSNSFIEGCKIWAREQSALIPSDDGFFDIPSEGVTIFE